MTEIQKNLLEKIKNSPVLKQKLTEEQIQKFIKKVFELPEEGQDTILDKFSEDEEFFIKQNEEISQIIEEYKQEMKKLENDFKKDFRNEMENEEIEKNLIETENLLEELDKI